VRTPVLYSSYWKAVQTREFNFNFIQGIYQFCWL